MIRKTHTLPSFKVRMILQALPHLSVGQLTLSLPGQSTRHIQGKQQLQLQADIQIHDYQGLDLVAQKGGIGLFEAYQQGYITSSDWVSLIHLLATNQNAFANTFYGSFWGKFSALLKHMFNLNTKRQSKKNIHAHYDISNQFYEMMLDKSMTYSSALFSSQDQDLHQAQQNKFQRIIDQLDIQAGQHVLEIGCGWGGFADYLLEHYDVKLTGITLSQQQLVYCQQRFKDVKHAQFELRDYRDLQQRYDHIVSIEMFEAVGERYWQTYFDTIQRHLNPHGAALIQVITIDDKYFPQYRKTTDFIQQYVFPGGMLPSLESLQPLIKKSRLKLEDIFFFGKDYAHTLSHWLDNFNTNLPHVEAMGFDERFIKTWSFYLWYCIAGFSAERINVGQLLIKSAEQAE